MRPTGAGEVGDQRHHGHHPEIGVLAQRPGEDVADVVAPEVLVLDVDQSPGTFERLGVAAGDAALPAVGERVVAPEAQVGVGAQQLDDVGAALDRRWRGRLLRQRVRGQVHPGQPVLGPAQRAAAERRRVLPPFPEHGLDVDDGRPADRSLDVVPRRVVAVLLGQDLGLRVAVVLGVVAPGVAQVDPADVGDVPGLVVTVADDEHLLVVGAAEPDPHVEQRLRAALLEPLAEAAVLLGGEAQGLLVRAPDQAADVDAALVGATEHRGDLAARLADQLLVGVALPVGEEDQVALTGRLEPFVELGVVRRPVDERPDQVALRPRLLAGVVVVEPRARVAALARGQQPVGRVRHEAHPARRRRTARDPPRGRLVAVACTERRTGREPARGHHGWRPFPNRDLYVVRDLRPGGRRPAGRGRCRPSGRSGSAPPRRRRPPRAPRPARVPRRGPRWRGRRPRR